MTEIKMETGNNSTEYKKRLVPLKLYYTISSRYSRVRLNPDRAEKLISENSALPLKIYRDKRGNTLCIKSGRRYSKMMSSYIAVKKKGRDKYKIYFPPDKSELIDGYDLESHKVRYIMESAGNDPASSFISQIELARALNLPLANTNTLFRRAVAVQQLLDRLAEIMGLEEIENPWLIDPKSGRKYMRDDL